MIIFIVFLWESCGWMRKKHARDPQPHAGGLLGQGTASNVAKLVNITPISLRCMANASVIVVV